MKKVMFRVPVLSCRMHECSFEWSFSFEPERWRFKLRNQGLPMDWWVALGPFHFFMFDRGAS